MTREEAKEYWTAKYEAAREWDDPHWEASERKEHRRYVDALKAALEALKAKTDGDLISREDAIKVSAEWMYEEFGYLDLNRGERFINAIESLPSAEPKTKCVAQIKVDTENIAKRIKEECGVELLFPGTPQIGDEIIAQGTFSLIRRDGDGTTEVELQNVKAIMKV